MFSSRLAAAAQSSGAALELVARPADLPNKLAPDCRLVIIDLSANGLDLPNAVATVRAQAPGARIVAYGAHVNEAALDFAAQAGCDTVLSRGEFNKRHVELLRAATV